MALFLQNVTAILGFGFLGLSFLFVFLAYRNVRQIVDQENPSEAAVALSRFFMITALAFMVCAGPLQWASVALDHYISKKGVTLLVTMTHPEWDDTFGEIWVVEKGKGHSLINSPYTGVFQENDEIQLNASKVAAAIRRFREQLTVLNNAISERSLSQSNRTTISVTDRANLGGG